MNRIEEYSKLKTSIVTWIQNYTKENNIKTLVVGVSGGIDSAVVSTLCAETGLPTYVLGMPIHQKEEQESLSDAHLEYLQNTYSNVIAHKFDLSKTFDTFKFTMKELGHDTLALANSRSRLRMVTLYQVAGSVSGIVVGTGNKVEDYGVGFYTKYGDGGVDISPIADCNKSQVWELGKHLGVSQEIINAQPTDGLWDDGRNDIEQLGMSYADLEKAMENKDDPNYQKYLEIREKNLHKMNPIPVCTFND